MDPLSILQSLGPYAPALVYAWIAVALAFAYWRTRRTSSLAFVWVAILGLLNLTIMPSWTYESDMPWWINYGLYAFLPLLFLLLPYLIQRGVFGNRAKARASDSGEATLPELMVFHPPGSESAGQAFLLVAAVVLVLGFVGISGVGLQPCRWLDVALGHSGCIRQVAYGGSVQALAFSPDGSLLVVGGSEHTADLRRVSDGQLVRTLSGHADWVSAASFSPDGSLLATASWDKTVRLWRVSDGAVLHEMRAVAPKDGLVSLAYSPDGKTLAAGTGGGANEYAIWLWNAADGSLLRTFRSGGSQVAFSPDGATLATEGQDGSVVLSRVADGTTLLTVPVERSDRSAVIDHLDFSPDGNLLVYQASDGGLHFVEVAGGKPIRTLQPGDLGGPLAFSPDWTLLAYTPRGSSGLKGDGGHIEVRRVSDGSQVGSFVAGKDLMYAAAFAPDGETMALATPWSRVRLWRIDH